MLKDIHRWIAAAFWSVTVLAGPVAAADPSFETDVQPVLKASCVGCHGPQKKKADLDLSTAAGLLKGGESGPVVVAGNPAKSRLFELVHEGEMPPAGKERLSTSAAETIRKWIEAGAKVPPSATNKGTEVTQHEIEPLMKLRCGTCHGLRKQEGGLDLRTKASMLKGGKSGPAIVLGKPGDSLMLKRVHAGQMPPEKLLIDASVKPMSPDEIDLVARWIARGAPEVRIEPDVATTTPDSLVTDKDRQFWSFRRPKAAPLPAVKSAGWVRTPVDAFVLAALEAKGLSPSPEADRLTLLRRVSFDLTGLPPTHEEVAAVRTDSSPMWYDRLVDRLLASPRYGEKWGRMWLDLAGYADSEGKRSADPVRPFAWLYRDYVIRSFNADKPYDRFLLEQIAGDELADAESATTLTPELMDNLVATGFLRMAPDGTGSDVVNFVPERLEVIADELQIFGQAVLGLTIHCARCHSHKYDPIPQRDYYRLAATFKGAFDEHDWLKPAAAAGQSKEGAAGRSIAAATAELKAQWEAERERQLAAVEALKVRLKKEGKPAGDGTRAEQFVKMAYPAEVRLHTLWDRGEPSNTYLYRRGDYLQPGKLVGPGVLSVLTDGKTPFEPTPPWPSAKKTGRRLALAKWLTVPDHPLTARVMANRIWKHHFGEGIVRSLGNFGTQGTPPSHPELLDWLAVEFVRSGWSVKHLHRLMVTSAVYRQTSTVNADHERLDQDNLLLSRMPMRRLTAEEVYDTLLAVSGRLEESRFGPPDSVEIRGDGLVTAMPTVGGGYRRAVYVRQRRSQVPTLLETFDLPQMNPACSERGESIVASQALYLSNNGGIADIATALASRVERAGGNNPARRVEWASLFALGRTATPRERKVGINALEELTGIWAGKLATPERAEAPRRALADYCHALLNSAAFLYVD